MLENYDNWIFDWSGTIVDDMALVIDATNHVMRQYEKPEFTRESFRSSFYLPYREWYEDVLPSVELDEIENHFRRGFRDSDKGVPVLPYAREFLEILKTAGKKLYVCTSMDAEAFEKQAAEHQLNPYFVKTYAGVLDKKELIGDILSEHEMEKSKTIFVGDMIHDIETANHGGISSLAVLTGYNAREELESSSPTLIVPDYSEFVE